jgi:hypothetical protein
LVVDGISDWLGETPADAGWRSKGSFCESEEFEALPDGGRPQAAIRRISTNPMIFSETVFTAATLGGTVSNRPEEEGIVHSNTSSPLSTRPRPG